MKSHSQYNCFFKFLFLMLIFLWLQNYSITNIFGSLYSRAIELALLSIAFFLVIVGRKFYISKSVFLFFLFYSILIVSGYFFDSSNQYKNELYFKTIIYISYCVFIAYALAYCFDNDEDWNFVIRVLGMLSFLFIVLVFGYAYFYLSWQPGNTLLNTSLGQYYQGLSRGVGLSLLILVLSIGYISNFFIVFGSFLSLIIIIAFNSMGALFAVFLSFLFFIIKNKNNKWMAFLFFSFLLITFLSLPMLIEVESVNMIISRAIDKASDSSESSGSRIWLMGKGLELWGQSSFINILFGSGATRYSEFVGYADSYRHPHNLFILLIVWFGLFSLFIYLIIFKYIFRSALCFLKVKRLYFISGILLYFFFLALIGGDIEQNRHFIFLFTTFYILYRRSSQEFSYDKN